MDYVLGFLLLNIGLSLWGILFIFTQVTVMVDEEQKMFTTCAVKN
jgi:hypothetical protein